MSVARHERPAVERVRPPIALVRLANPVVRRLLMSPWHGLVSKHLAVVRYTGRRSGRRFALPVGRQELDGSPVVISNSPWRMNFRGGREAELLVAGEWCDTRATLVSDVERVSDFFERRMTELGWRDAARALGIRVNVDRRPTHAELADAIRSSGLSLVVFEPAPTSS
jgi:hypothetical protein